MYPDENQSKLMDVNAWLDKTSDMSWGNAANTSIPLLLTNTALICQYVKAAGSFKCPGDSYNDPTTGARVRSYSMNGVLGGTAPNPKGPAPNGGTFFGGGGLGAATKPGDLNLPGPVNVFVVLDEHPDSINDAIYAFNPGSPPGSGNLA